VSVIAKATQLAMWDLETPWENYPARGNNRELPSSARGYSGLTEVWRIVAAISIERRSAEPMPNIGISLNFNNLLYFPQLVSGFRIDLAVPPSYYTQLLQDCA